MIDYEYPLNERVRTWLRIEDLFAKAETFMARTEQRDHHAAMQAIFELVEVTARPDLKSELLQEIERQRIAFDLWRDNPAVDGEALEGVLAQMQLIREKLLATSGKPCQSLRENEWLSAIRNRSFIPGASCSFDIPSYHYWLHLPSAERSLDLAGWLAVLDPVREAVLMVMRLLREGRQRSTSQAEKGVCQINLGGRIPMLLTIRMQPDFPCVPEISAGKHVINLRFVTIDKQHRPRLCEQDVPFELML